MAVSPDPRGHDAGSGSPAWLEVPVLSAVAVIAGALVPGLALAAVGAFRPLLAGPLMAVTGALAAIGVRPALRTPRAGATSAAHAAAAVALAGVALFSVFHLRGTGQWVLTDRDPGAVASAAAWLADEGRLDGPDAPGAFSSADFASSATAQGWFRDGTRVTPQFMHGTHVALAAARWVGGDGALLGLNALLSALAALCLFVLAVRWMPPWAAAGAAVSLAALAPQAYVARAPFTEPLAQLLLLGAAALLLAAVRRGARPGLVVAGVVLGALVVVRIDGVLALAALGPWLAVRAHAARREGGAPGVETLWVGLGTAVVAAVAALDATGPAAAYLGVHASEVLSELALMALVWAGSLGWYLAMSARVDDDLDQRAPWRAVAGLVAGVALVVLVAGLWFVRPQVETTRETAPSLTVETLQEAEHLPVDPTRRYFEDSVRWLSWYLGPLGLALAAVGAAAGVRACVEGGDRDSRMLLVLGLAALPTAVFVWRVRTTPDHLWVMRRFVPATLPLLVATAWAAVGGAAGVVSRWSGRVATVAAVAVAVLASAMVAIPILVTYAPLHEMSVQMGVLDEVRSTCDALGPDAAVLALAEETSALVLPATLRAECRVPVAGATRVVARDELIELSKRWAVAGRRLYVVSDTAGFLTQLLGPRPVQEFSSRGRRDPVATIGGPPDRLRRHAWFWVIAPV
ncbi:MAG: hypothetical protein ACRD1K_01790 [Acidimicrobiales bacterium]